MIRAVLRSLGRFSAAVVLLALLLCAVEVCLRANRLRLDVKPNANLNQFDAVIPSQTTYYEIQPLKTWTFETSSGDTKLCHTNELGMRGDSVAVPKPAGVFRILCCGSDDTFGVGIDQHQVFCKRLQEFLQPLTTRKIEVINAGCPKAGLLVNYLRLRHQFNGLQPDVVVMNFNVEDLYWDQQVRGSIRVDEQQQPAYAIHPKYMAKGSKFVDEACKEFVVVDWMVDHMGGLVGVNAPRSERALVNSTESQPNQFDPIFLAQRLANAQGAKLMVSLTPSPWTLQKPDANRPATSTTGLVQDLQSAIQQAQLSTPLPINESSEVFQRSPYLKELFSPHSGLLSPRGHDLYARTLARFIVQHVSDIWDAPDTTTQTPPQQPNPFLMNGNSRSSNQNTETLR